MESVSLAKLKNELSSYIKMVKSGKRLLITMYNQPVAKLIPLRDDISSSAEEVIASLLSQGIASCGNPLSRFEKPFMVEINGESASDLLIRMRE